jgi:hypothetical protein
MFVDVFAYGGENPVLGVGQGSILVSHKIHER